MFDSNKLVQKDRQGRTIYSAKRVSFESKAEIIDYIDATAGKIVDIRKMQTAEIIV